MKRVIIESPYAGHIDRNVSYARQAMRDSLERGEAPIASHLLYTQPGILRDDVLSERETGIKAGLAWRSAADLTVFYTDLGWSPGMTKALALCMDERRAFEVRNIISGKVWHSDEGLTVNAILDGGTNRESA
jgi:hypothetical protein